MIVGIFVLVGFQDKAERDKELGLDSLQVEKKAKTELNEVDKNGKTETMEVESTGTVKPAGENDCLFWKSFKQFKYREQILLDSISFLGWLPIKAGTLMQVTTLDGSMTKEVRSLQQTTASGVNNLF